jgi:hypothetical protein
MHTFSVEVRLPDELREQFEARVRAYGGNEEDYLREVVVRDLRSEPPHPGMTFREIFAPSQAGFSNSETTDDELAEFVEAEVKQYRAERRTREARGG